MKATHVRTASKKAKSKSRAPRHPGRGQYNRDQTLAERSTEVRRKLMNGAIEVMSKNTYLNTSVETVIRHLGLGRSTFYAHFPNLEALLAAVYAETLEWTFGFIAHEMAREADPFKRVEVGIDAYLKLTRENEARSLVIFRDFRTAGSHYMARREDEIQRYAALIHRAMVDAHRTGKIEQSPNEKTAYALVGAIEALGLNFLMRGKAHLLEKEVGPVLKSLARGAYA